MQKKVLLSEQTSRGDKATNQAAGKGLFGDREEQLYFATKDNNEKAVSSIRHSDKSKKGET
jgi:hypothetical protein